MATVTVCNNCTQSITIPAAAGGTIVLNGAQHGRLTFNVQEFDYNAWAGDAQWLPGLASGAIYATVNS